MSRCRQCNVEILDETDRCPLCRSALEHTFEVENMYPNVRVQTRKWVFWSRVYLFTGILLEAIFFGINFVDKYKIGWSLIAGLFLLYGYFIIQLSILGQAGHKLKIVLLSAIAIVMMVLIDFMIGYDGWSVNYALPGIVIMLDIWIMILMFVNRRNWQSYIMWQILMILVSVMLGIFEWIGIITVPYVASAAILVSVFLFLGTVIIGDRRARVELKRRFHIM